ncbi:MAG: 30S ribosomal protein S14 [Neomegalonema sp.]|nr:30S ribosomal protein S14 [Neomegalonema sp.]
MAKVAMVERQKKRERLVAKYAKKREELKAIIANQELDQGERIRATLQLAKLPRNSSTTRLHNRCQVSGRPKAYYRKLKMSRIALRELGNKGLLPGVVKSSW